MVVSLWGRKEPIIMARKINNVVKVEAVSTISKEVAEVTNFKTLADAETILTKLDNDSNKNRYLVGSVFNAVKEKGLVKDVRAWAEKFGYRPNTVYQLGLIAKNFTLDDCIKFGMGKLIEIRNKENMEKLLESGVTEANTSAEIREKVKESKGRTTTGTRRKSMKTMIKEDIKTVSTLTKSIKLPDEFDEFLKTLSTCGGSRENIPELYGHLDRAMIILCEYEEILNKKLNEIETEELKKKEEKEKRKAEKAKNNK